MTKISFIYDERSRVTGFEFKGHAGYGEAGTDIVCAAISALVFTTMNSIEAFSKTAFEGEQDKDKGRIYFRLTDEPDREALVLLGSLKLGVEQIQKSYGKKYIRIEN